MTPSPTTPSARAAVPRCLHLRSKMDYIALGGPPDLDATDDASDSDAAPRYCLHTLTVIGPDGDIVGPRVCTPERTCYESSGF